MGAGTSAQSGKDIELHVAEATGKNVDLDAQVNHKVELVGTMSSKDLAAIKGGGKTGAGGQSGSGTGYGAGSSTTGTGTGTSTTGQTGTSGTMGQTSTMSAPPLMFKATSVKSISDKCQ
jgi:hypothetical protein